MLHAGVLKKFGLYGLAQIAGTLASESAQTWSTLNFMVGSWKCYFCRTGYYCSKQLGNRWLVMDPSCIWVIVSWESELAVYWVLLQNHANGSSRPFRLSDVFAFPNTIAGRKLRNELKCDGLAKQTPLRLLFRCSISCHYWITRVWEFWVNSSFFFPWVKNRGICLLDLGSIRNYHFCNFRLVR